MLKKFRWFEITLIINVGSQIMMKAQIQEYSSLIFIIFSSEFCLGVPSKLISLHSTCKFDPISYVYITSLTYN